MSLEDFNLVKLEEITGGNGGVLLHATCAEKNNRPALSSSFQYGGSVNFLCLKKLDTNIKANKLYLEEYRNLLVERSTNSLHNGKYKTTRTVWFVVQDERRSDNFKHYEGVHGQS